MKTEDSRGFRIADGLLLIAGVAAGLGLVRVLSPELTPQELWKMVVQPEEGWSFSYALELTMLLGMTLVTPFLVGWTPFCLVVQLVKPRAPWRRLRRQPGFVACLAVLVAVVLTLAAGFAGEALSQWSVTARWPDGLLGVTLLGQQLAGFGVFWCWLMMIVCRVCRPRRTWTDRLGRLTGAAWIVFGALIPGYKALEVSMM